MCWRATIGAPGTNLLLAEILWDFFFYYGLNRTTICAFSLWNCDNLKSFFSLLSMDCVFIHNNAFFFFFPVESLFITSLLSYNFAFSILFISSLEQILLAWLGVLKALASPSSKTCCYTLKFYLSSLSLLSLHLVYLVFFMWKPRLVSSLPPKLQLWSTSISYSLAKFRISLRAQVLKFPFLRNF